MNGSFCSRVLWGNCILSQYEKVIARNLNTPYAAQLPNCVSKRRHLKDQRGDAAWDNKPEEGCYSGGGLLSHLRSTADRGSPSSSFREPPCVLFLALIDYFNSKAVFVRYIKHLGIKS